MSVTHELRCQQYLYVVSLHSLLLSVQNGAQVLCSLLRLKCQMLCSVAQGSAGGMLTALQHRMCWHTVVQSWMHPCAKLSLSRTTSQCG